MDILKKFRVDEFQAEGNLSRNQKLAVIGLAILGFLIIFLWSMGMKNNIYAPLSPKGQVADQDNACPGGNCALTEEQRQKTQDTDGDGLTDWNEINVFGTSAYLEDTDSDGITDGVEVQNNQDPNCPLGQDCGRSSAVVSSEADASSPLAVEPEEIGNLIASSSSVMTNEQVQANQEDFNKVFGGQADAKVLRKLLIDSGIKKELLDKMSDEELLQSYLTTLQGVQKSSQ